MSPLPIALLICLPLGAGTVTILSDTYRTKPRRERVFAFLQSALISLITLLSFNWLVS